MATQFISPIGRLVQGDVFKGNTKDPKTGQPLVTKTGANAGQPRTSFFIALAVPKKIKDQRQGSQTFGQLVDNYEFAAFWQLMNQEARAAFPQLFNAQGACTHPRFAWKYADGDGVDNDGKPNSGKPGHAGCWILKFGSSFAPKVLHQGQYIIDESAVKRGYYVRVAGNMSDNKPSEVPGLYLNHEAVELVAYGEEIRSGIDAIAAFGGQAMGYVPEGASATPPTPTQPMGGMPQMPGQPAGGMPQQPMGGMPQMPGQPAGGMPQQPMGGMPQMPGQPAGGMPQQPMGGMPQMPGQPAGGMPQQPIAPNHQFVQNAAGYASAAVTGVQQPQMPGQPPAPQYAPTAAAGGYTWEQWIATGATPEQLVQGGMFVRTA